MTASATRRVKWLLCALLGAAVLVAFAPALYCGFVNIDDPDYVTSNWHVQHGFNWPDVRWAFTSVATYYWHPLTWLSHTLDCQLYGLEPAGHHLTSLFLHAANAVLLFLLLHRLTGALGRSAQRLDELRARARGRDAHALAGQRAGNDGAIGRDAAPLRVQRGDRQLFKRLRHSAQR